MLPERRDPSPPGPPGPPAPPDTRVPAVRRVLARAAVSPVALGVTGAGVAIGALDHSAWLAIVLGAGAWVGRMAVAAAGVARRSRRAPRGVDVDPWAVPEPWRQLVRQAVAARARFDGAIGTWPPGPLRDHLVQIQGRVHTDVEQLWGVARRGAALSGWSPAGAVTSGHLPTAEISEQLRRIQAEARAAGASPDRLAALSRSEQSLAAQLRAARRADDAAAAVLDRLRLHTARLDEAVTSLLQLGIGAAGPDDVAALDRSLQALTDEVAALHDGLAEVTGEDPSGHQDVPVPRPGPPTGPAPP